MYRIGSALLSMISVRESANRHQALFAKRSAPEAREGVFLVIHTLGNVCVH
ncbi:hypothetical protein MPQ_2563 [Methylovorus sp. MP688]|nr:hypothetical protein MPQ_2563 [Methylovorus sp. MP688]